MWFENGVLHLGFWVLYVSVRAMCICVGFCGYGTFWSISACSLSACGVSVGFLWSVLISYCLCMMCELHHSFVVIDREGLCKRLGVVLQQRKFIKS